MLKIQEVANFLNSELNLINPDYSFDIKAEIGKRENADAIYGIISTTKAVPSVDENTVEYEFTVELSVPSAQTNENIIKIEEIIGELKNKFHMKNYTFGGGKGLLSFTLARPKDYQIKYVVADEVPLVFTISTNLIRGGVGSGDKHWLLNGLEIPFITENVSIEKDGRTNSINGESYTKTLMTRQTRYYRFSFDYDNSELCVMLQKDLLDGKYDKVYNLTYYDGVSFTEEQPFTTSVSIFRNGMTSSAKPKVAEFDITFTDIDDGAVVYEMALIDNPFDSTTENTRYFNSQEEQRAYYQAKIDDSVRHGGVGCDWVKIKAPNLSSIDITNQVYEIPLYDGEPIYDLFNVTNKNYAIIRVTKGEEQQWFYYFVANQNIGGQNQVMFDLKLDSIQTYYFNPDLKFGDCLIERGHLNRWVDNGDETVSFDGGVDSKLFEREDIQNVAKRLTKRTKVGVNNHNQPEVDEWLNTNVKCWLYCYLDPTHPFQSYYPTTLKQTEDIFDNIRYFSKGTTERYGGQDIPSNISCICQPIYNSSKYIKIKFPQGAETSEYVRRVGFETLNYFFELNSGYKYVYATKVSFLPPFNNEQFKYEIDNFGNLVLIADGYANSLNNVDFRAGNNGTYSSDLFIRVQTQDYELLSQNYNIDIELTFNKVDLINKEKNPKFNPKLLSQDYKELRLADNTEDGFIYDIQKLNKNTVQIITTEPLVPDIAKRYLRIKNKDGVYIEETNENLTGFVNSNDNSLIMPTSAYQSMMAQNKNFFLQNSINRGFDIARGLTGTGGSLIQSGISAITSKTPGLNMASAGVSTALSLANIGLNYASNKINENLTIDNLKNAPGTIVAAKGNAIFESMYSEIGIIVEEYDILPNEKEIINDYMCKYGFTVNRFGNPKDYDNIRHYYNFVKAQIDSISGIAISNTARDDIRQRFMNGIRFWNSDDVDYDHENYEEWLAE